MKTEDLITLAAAAVLAYVAYKTFARNKTGIAANAAPARITPATNQYAQEIKNNADPGEPGWGWKYYTNGVAISPDGTYYLNEQPVWNL